MYRRDINSNNSSSDCGAGVVPIQTVLSHETIGPERASISVPTRR